MWYKKAQRKKIQLFLTGVMLFAVAGLLNMSLCLTGELSSFSKWAINDENCPDGYILTIGTKNFEDHFMNDSYQNEVECVSALSGKAVTVPIKYNGKDITQMHDMMLSADNWEDFDYLELKSGDIKTTGPGKGEVWLSEVLTKPNDIRLGDTLTIKYASGIDGDRDL